MAKLGDQAVVVGGSMVGLMAAQALSNHFGKVLVVERDTVSPFPDIHKSIPQGNHYHALLAGGYQVLDSLYRDFAQELERNGAVRFRAPRDVVFLFSGEKTYNPTGHVRERRDFGIESFSMSRGLLEFTVRNLTRRTSNIELMSPARVVGLLLDGTSVRELKVEYNGRQESIRPDLVIEATGRSTRLPRNLKDNGFGEVPETDIGVDFSYSSAKLAPPADLEPEESLYIMFQAQAGQRPVGGILGAVEDGLWHLSLAGRFGDYPPDDEEGFLAFARSLDEPFLNEFLDAGASLQSGVVSYRYPRSLWRHYDQMPAFPSGIIPLGDSVASFNPVYGQGMSSGANQVRVLGEALAASDATDLPNLAQAVLPRLAEVVAVPWNMASNQDYMWEQTTGTRPPDLAQRLAYALALGEASAAHPDVHEAALRVAHLAIPPTVLMEEPLGSKIAAFLGSAQSA